MNTCEVYFINLPFHGETYCNNFEATFVTFARPIFRNYARYFSYEVFCINFIFLVLVHHQSVWSQMCHRMLLVGPSSSIRFSKWWIEDFGSKSSENCCPTRRNQRSLWDRFECSKLQLNAAFQYIFSCTHLLLFQYLLLLRFTQLVNSFQKFAAKPEDRL